ncbi:MAG: DUF547 domain-containing protein [Pirellulaceae bacterium]
MTRMPHKPAFAAVLLVIVVGSAAHAGSKVFVGSQVASRNQVSMDRIDHSAWEAILRKYVDDDGMVRYREFSASTPDVRALDGYLQTLSTASRQIRARREAQLSFWVNAYNAVTVRGILKEYPTSSIRNHTAKLWGYNIWKDLQLYVGTEAYSLEQMEHEILRKMGEPRIHFAIVCASVGCPRLLNEAYVPARVQEQLEANARDFFSRSRNFRYDQRNRRFYLSSIFKWFGGDFGQNRAAQLRTISQWLPEGPSRQAAMQSASSVSFLEYDWSLNERVMTSRR